MTRPPSIPSDLWDQIPAALLPAIDETGVYVDGAGGAGWWPRKVYLSLLLAR